MLAERTYHESCALRARTERLNAEACNDMLTPKEAAALAIAIEAFPDIAVDLIETVFEGRHWPNDCVDEAWLTDTGRAVWAAYGVWRGEVVA